MREPLFDRAYSITIAFLIPGLVVLASLASFNAAVAAWFTGAANGPTFAGLFFVMLAALTLGLVITSIRWVVFEVLQWPGVGCLVKPGPRLDHRKRSECEAAYLDIRLNHYYYYLASANLAVALPMGVTLWKAGSDPAPTWSLFIAAIALSAAATAALAYSGCGAVRRYDQKRQILLGILADERDEPSQYRQDHQQRPGGACYGFGFGGGGGGGGVLGGCHDDRPR